MKIQLFIFGLPIFEIFIERAQKKRTDRIQKMITVSILINGNPVLTRSAVNRTPERGDDKPCRYQVDDGSFIMHKRSDGAVVLAHKLLDKIKEPK